MLLKPLRTCLFSSTLLRGILIIRQYEILIYNCELGDYASYVPLKP